MDTFSGYHPLINFTYFVIVIGLSMFYMHPVFLALSLIGSVSYSIYLKGRKTVKVFLFGMLPVCLLAAAANPLFSHAGATMLFYLKDGNPVTLESIVYGLASGLMLAGVISWFSVFHEVMTSDKFMYLFGKVIPAFSLLLSMTLRFVPRFTEQIKRVAEAQQCIGRNVNNGNRQPQIRKYLFRHMHLTFSTIHQYQIRKLAETAEFVFFLVFLFLDSPPEPPGQHFLHAGVIVRSLYRFDLELTVIVSFWFSLFIDHHGTYRLKTADIGNIVGLYSL